MTKQTRAQLATVLLLVLVLCSTPLPGHGESVPTATGAQQQPPAPATAPAAAPPESLHRVTGYTLPPDRYAKARDLSRIRFQFAIISFIYGVVVLWMVLRWKLAPKYRTWAETASSNRFVQALVFSPLLILT